VRNWWTPADFDHFEAATAKLAAQFDTYKPFPDVSVNGKQTLSENIADLAGVTAANDGYHASLAGKTAPTQGSFNGDQQFSSPSARTGLRRRGKRYSASRYWSIHMPPRSTALTRSAMLTPGMGRSM